MEWLPIDSAPRDGSEIMLHYKEYLGVRDFIVSGHWFENGPLDSTWEHSHGWGDADNWMPLPAPPKGE